MPHRSALLPSFDFQAELVHVPFPVMQVRDEHATDADAIGEVVAEAFGRDDEARLVERLRTDGDAIVSVVAEEGDRIVGHVLLSRMDAPFRALGLAPLSVLPKFERRGIGAELVRAAVERARALGWDAIFVLGDPKYYGRFGFRADLAAGFASLYAGPHLMVLPLGGDLPKTSGAIDYAAAFADLD